MSYHSAVTSPRLTTPITRAARSATRFASLVRQSQFLRNNGIYFFGSLAAAVLNYIYYPILGRLLPVTAFGEVQTLVSVFMQATIFLTVVTNVAVNVVTNEPDNTRASRVVLELERFATFIMLAAMALALLFVQDIAAFLQFPDTLPFFLLAASLVIGAPAALSSAYLRGRNAFGSFSLSGIIIALAKLLASGALVLAGFGTAGAIGGLVAAQLVALMYNRTVAGRFGLKTVGPLWRRIDLAVIKPQIPYAVLVLTVSLVITTLFSLDVVVAKHYFPAETAGAYAGVATIARIIFFLTGSIAVVLLSSIKLGAKPAANRRLLTRSLALQAGLGGGTLLIFTLAPNFIIQVLLGTRYLEYAHLLPGLSLALFLLASLNLFFAYDLALRRHSAAVIALLGAGLMTALIAAHHNAPDALVNSLIWGAAIMLALRAGDSIRRWFWRSRQTS